MLDWWELLCDFVWALMVVLGSRFATAEKDIAHSMLMNII